MQILQSVMIRSISYTGVDINNKKIFVFIANDLKKQLLMCHVYESKKAVRNLSLSLMKELRLFSFMSMHACTSSFLFLSQSVAPF
jgi:hypothetical protein